MTTLTDLQTWIDHRLPELIDEHDVPAAAVAVCIGDDVIDAATGLLSLGTGVEATTDSVFQIGSITKVWTATLVMQLVDEGLVDLDEHVQHYVPDFRVADSEAAASMTVRQLLSHTAGFEGDIFDDTGPGDDALAKLIARLDDVPQLFPPGEMFSYNNAGYCLLGRLVEEVRERPFDECLRTHLIRPLGLTHAATGPAEAILFRAAVGHVRPDPETDQQPAPFWAMAHSNAPAGSMLSMRARDLVAFARMHMRSGQASDGTSVLGADAVALMQKEHVRLPDLRVLGAAWGLGWELFDGPGPALIGHDGNTVGQAAFLRVVPELGVAVALLTNGGNPYGIYRDLFGHVLTELAEIELPPLPVPAADPPAVEAAPYLGTYANRVADISVSLDEDGRIWSKITPKGAAVELGEEPERTELVGFGDDVLIPTEPTNGLHIPHAFLGDDGTGRKAYLHIGRAVPRVPEVPTT